MGSPPANVDSKQGVESWTEEGETEASTGLHCSLLPDHGYNVSILPRLLAGFVGYFVAALRTVANTALYL